MTLRDTLLFVVDYNASETEALVHQQLSFLQGIEVNRSWLGSFFSDPYDVSGALWDCASNEYNLRVITTASSQNQAIIDALRATNPVAADAFVQGFNQISVDFNTAIGAAGGFTLSQYVEDVSGFTQAFFGSALNVVMSQAGLLNDAYNVASATISTSYGIASTGMLAWDVSIASVNRADDFFRNICTSLTDVFTGRATAASLADSFITGLSSIVRSLDAEQFSQLTGVSSSALSLISSTASLESKLGAVATLLNAMSSGDPGNVRLLFGISASEWSAIDGQAEYGSRLVSLVKALADAATAAMTIGHLTEYESDGDLGTNFGGQQISDVVLSLQWQEFGAIFLDLARDYFPATGTVGFWLHGVVEALSVFVESRSVTLRSDLAQLIDRVDDATHAYEGATSAYAALISHALQELGDGWGASAGLTLWANSAGGDLFASNTAETINGSSVVDHIFAGGGGDLVYGGDGNDDLRGGDGNDTVYGGSGFDILYGGAQDDDLRGGENDDSLKGEAGNDTLYGGAGNDSLYGDENNDFLKGEAGNDFLVGGSGNDQIFGDGGDDRLVGEAGADTLRGGAGHDVFVLGLFDQTYGQQTDTIPDYNRGTGVRVATEGDLIDLSGIHFATSTGFGSASTVRLRSVGTNGDLPSGAVLEVDTGDGVWRAIARLEGVATGEAVRLALTGAQAASGTGTSFIVDGVGNGHAWTVTPGAQNVAEADTTITFTITRSGTNLGAETVYVSTAQNHGIYNEGDYDGRANVALSFAAGVLSKTFTVHVNPDANPEGDETFGLIVQSDPRDPISTFVASASFTIQDGATPTASGQNWIGDELDNVRSGGSFNDILLGMAGNDRLTGYGGSDVLAGGEGDDSLYGGAGNDTIVTGAGINYVDAGSGNDVIDARQENYAQGTVLAGTGDDTIFVGSANQGGVPCILTVDGGSGTDRLVVEARNSDAGQWWDRYEALISHEFGSGARLISNSSFADIEAAIASGGTHTVSSAVFYYNGGTWASDIATTGIEQFEYRGAAGDDLFLSWGDNMRVALGGAGTDALYADWSTTTAAIVWNVTVNNDIERTLGNGVVVQSIERLMLYTGSGNDNLVMGDQDDHVETGAGNDRLTGGGGNDVLIGGAGKDTVTGGSGADSLDGGIGNDTVNYSNSVGGVNVDLSLNAASGGDAAGDTIFGFENLVGGAGFDTLTGSSAANVMSGNDGNDNLNAGGGNDTLFGGAGNDALTGGSASDSLVGGSGADTLEGGTGSDTLVGGTRKDLLTGGTGSDVFVFDAAVIAGNADRISDFSVVDDTIRLNSAVFTGLVSGSLAADAFAANNTGNAMAATDRIIYETDTGGLYFDSDGVGGLARVQFATIGTGLALTSGDFVVF